MSAFPQKFIGRGKSKKMARHMAAEMALRSFVQFPDASEAHQALGRGFLPHHADFTSDADISKSSIFNNFEDNGKAMLTEASQNVSDFHKMTQVIVSKNCMCVSRFSFYSLL